MHFELLILLVIATCLQEGMGIKCYQCNSARDPNCGDPFNPAVAVVDCEQLLPGKNATFCRKNVQKVSMNGTTNHRIVRACGFQKEEDDEMRCYNRAGTFEVTVTYCSCRGKDGEPCNGGHQVMPSMLAGLSALAIGTSTILMMSTLLF